MSDLTSELVEIIEPLLNKLGCPFPRNGAEQLAQAIADRLCVVCDEGAVKDILITLDPEKIVEGCSYHFGYILEALSKSAAWRVGVKDE